MNPTGPCPYTDGAPPPAPLTRREAEVAWWIAEDLRDDEIAARLGIALRTEHSHRDHILRKLHDLHPRIRTRVGIGVWILKQSVLPR